MGISTQAKVKVLFRQWFQTPLSTPMMARAAITLVNTNTAALTRATENYGTRKSVLNAGQLEDWTNKHPRLNGRNMRQYLEIKRSSSSKTSLPPVTHVSKHPCLHTDLPPAQHRHISEKMKLPSPPAAKGFKSCIEGLRRLFTMALLETPRATAGHRCVTALHLTLLLISVRYLGGEKCLKTCLSAFRN